MKRKFLLHLLVLAGLLSAAPAFAATCQNYTTLGALMTAGSCTIGSVTFSNFSYTNTVAANNVELASSGDGAQGSFAGLAFHTTGAWSTPFAINYTVNCAGCAFVGAHFNANIQPVFGAGGMTLNYTDSTGTYSASASNQDQFHAVDYATSDISNVLNAGGDNDRLQSLENDFYLSSTAASTPEPTSLLLFGSGFLVVGLAARTRRKRSV